MTLSALLMALALPIAVRVVAGLGFSIVTFTGVSAAVDGLISLAQSSWSAMPLAVLQLASLSGIPEALGVIMGAFAAKVALWSLVNGTRWMVRR